ncbi:hypothetical protein ACJJTC_008775 [Scirpophaga incertulas]
MPYVMFTAYGARRARSSRYHVTATLQPIGARCSSCARTRAVAPVPAMAVAGSPDVDLSEIKTRSIERTLLPLIKQISSLVSTRGESLTGGAAVQRVGAAVCCAVERFVAVGETIADDNPDVRHSMVLACKEARSAETEIRSLKHNPDMIAMSLPQDQTRAGHTSAYYPDNVLSSTACPRSADYGLRSHPNKPFIPAQLSFTVMFPLVLSCIIIIEASTDSVNKL